MESGGDGGLRERWHAWAQGTLGGSPAQVDAATDAVMRAIKAGADQNTAIQQAYSAWGAAGPSPAPPQQPPLRRHPAARRYPGIQGPEPGTAAHTLLTGVRILFLIVFLAFFAGMAILIFSNMASSP